LSVVGFFVHGLADFFLNFAQANNSIQLRYSCVPFYNNLNS
jgi:hypothetical protein